MAKSKFFEQIKTAIIEKDVEQVYNQGISFYFPNTTILHDFECDSMIDTKTTDFGKMLKLIIEYKFDENLKSRFERAKIILQILFYLKRFELNGKILPNVAMVGDKNECFVFHTNEIIKYLDKDDIDWTTAPSKASEKYSDFVFEIANNEDFNPFIFDIDENFSFKVVVDKINDLANNIQRYVHVTEHNIAVIFEYFTKNVFLSNKNKHLNANDVVALFIGIISDKDNYYNHPTKKGIIVTPFGEVKVNENGYKSFIAYFNRNYTPREKNKFTEISDRLIEDTNRRNKGEFYTPTLFVDYAHKMIEKELGENWKEEYVVWDNCCGAMNLTRDYRFKELYASTLEEAELDIAKRHNTESTKFQFDFLNDDIEEKCPNGLINAFEENKPIVFFLNPPYATAGINGAESKKGVAKTKVNEMMLNKKIGASAQNLYAQFLYRICKIKEHYKLNNVYIAVYCPTLFLTGSSFEGFRKYFLEQFKYLKGFTFKASHFADVADNWGIGCSLWTVGKTNDKSSFVFDVVDNIEGNITKIDEKLIYNIDLLSGANIWVKEKTTNKITFPHLSSGIKVKGQNYTWDENSIGYFYNKSNQVNKNVQESALFSAIFSDGHGLSILPSNFTRCTALFAARKLVSCNWINSKDEYMKPNTEHEKWKGFEMDSVIYSLFHSASNQSSLRNINYKEKKWNIKNEFFFMGVNEMRELANSNNIDEMYQDTVGDKERYVYSYIKEHYNELSEESKMVYDMACEMVRKSFKYRKIFNEEHEEYQILNWDCGYYQLKAIWKEFMKEDFVKFQKFYKILSEKMTPMVYELGFLKK